MVRTIVLCASVVLFVAACSSDGNETSPKSSGGSASNANGIGGSSDVRGSGGSVSASSSGGASAAGGAGDAGEIAVFADALGACPIGATKVDITTEAELESASRGEAPFADVPAGACFFIHNSKYVSASSSVGMYVKVGGSDATHRRLFVGESRSGVVVNGRASVDAGASHVQISNLTFDLTSYTQSGSFNTLTLLAGSTDLRVDHVTFTGDCMTGANGGHVEVDGSTDVVVEACIIEKFGRCGPNGHQDHGVYLGSGSNITIRNNDIRGNASRGVQFNTEGGSYGTLDNIVIERNRIHDNGHADYEDGIVMNATGTGTISNVLIQRNLIYGNYYSGIRESGGESSSVVIRNNTVYRNGVASTALGRSELNIDDVGSGAGTTVNRNIIVAANKILNDCYDSQPRGYALVDNLVQGVSPTGTAANCISGSVVETASFVDATSGDFHTVGTDYGAYGP